MKIKSYWLHLTLSGAFALLLAGSLQAQTLARYEAQTSGSKVKIEGTSTIHDWDVNSPIIGGFMEIDSAFLQNPSPGKVNAKANVVIPVRSLKSYKTSMDEVMQEHMKMKQFARITYTLTELVLKEAPKDAKAPLSFDSKGELTVSGVTNTVSFPVTITRADDSKMQITSGKIPLKMTSFKIEPPCPKIGLGLIKTGDDVNVSFDWMTAKAESK